MEGSRFTTPEGLSGPHRQFVVMAITERGYDADWGEFTEENYETEYAVVEVFGDNHYVPYSAMPIRNNPDYIYNPDDHVATDDDIQQIADEIHRVEENAPGIAVPINPINLALIETLVAAPVNTELVGELCIICFDEFEAEAQTYTVPGCEHTFHFECLRKWLETNTSCPLCRHPLQLERPAEPQIVVQINAVNDDAVLVNEDQPNDQVLDDAQAADDLINAVRIHNPVAEAHQDDDDDDDEEDDELASFSTLNHLWEMRGLTRCSQGPGQLLTTYQVAQTVSHWRMRESFSTSQSFDFFDRPRFVPSRDTRFTATMFLAVVPSEIVTRLETGEYD